MSNVMAVALLLAALVLTPAGTPAFDIPRSNAVFSADDNGHVDLMRTPPIRGSYNTVDMMGLLLAFVERALGAEARWPSPAVCSYCRGWAFPPA